MNDNPVIVVNYVVWTNSDLTDGRGQQIVLGITEFESTAQRIAKGKYVQGTDCPIEEVEVITHNGMWYGPISFVTPTKEDKAKEIKMREEKELEAQRCKILVKAKKLGLSEEEILVLKS